MDVSSVCVGIVFGVMIWTLVIFHFRMQLATIVFMPTSMSDTPQPCGLASMHDTQQRNVTHTSTRNRKQKLFTVESSGSTDTFGGHDIQLKKKKTTTKLKDARFLVSTRPSGYIHLEGCYHLSRCRETKQFMLCTDCVRNLQVQMASSDSDQ